MYIVALQTARKNSKSVKDKNIFLHNGKPLYLHNIDYASKCVAINDVYVTTDSEVIVANVNDADYKVIDRPKELTTDSASHYETIMHGLYEIERKEGRKVGIVVILLGNNNGAFTEDLSLAVNSLVEDDNIDSVISVSEFNMFNPFRAYKIDAEKVTTVVSQDFIKNNQKHDNINDKKSAGDVYFFNGSFWVCRRETLINNNGLLPFTWLGNNIKPIIQKDVMEVDAEWQLKCLL
jgi:N-acylneuraminate cytidylyltransferase